MVARLKEHERSDRFSRLAMVGALSYAVGMPAIDVALIFTTFPGGAANGMPALVATAAYLPLHLRHLWYAARASRPPVGGWTLLIMIVLIIGAFPFAGVHWVRAFPAIAIGALIVLRPPWSRWGAAAALIAPLPLGLAMNDNVAESFWGSTGVCWRTTVLVVLVWLAASIRRLRDGQQALADEAVARERRRIDDELEQTLGAALESIVARGERASARSTMDSAALEAELRALVDGARRTLAEARRMTGDYRKVSLRAELEAAATLLTAAGIHTRVALPRGDLPDLVEDSLRSTLRVATTRLLRDDTAESCVITVTRADGQVRLEVRADGVSLPMAEVVAV